MRPFSDSHAQSLQPRTPLKIYGRRPTAAPNALVEVKVDASESVGALAKALAAELQLGVSVNRVVLSLLDGVGNIVCVLNDPTATLEAAGVTTGVKVIVDARPAPSPPLAFPSLPPPIVFTSEDVGGERMMVTELLLEDTSTVPFFLTLEQHRELERFIGEMPSTREQLLMLTGTIKSGKTKIVHTVHPGMLSAAVASASRWPSTRLRPVIFKYSFPLGMPAEAAVMHLQRALAAFGREIDVPFDLDPTPADALANVHTALHKFASRIHAGGGELWQFWDELQGPVLGSTPELAQAFIYALKSVRAPSWCQTPWAFLRLA